MFLLRPTPPFRLAARSQCRAPTSRVRPPFTAPRRSRAVQPSRLTLRTPSMKRSSLSGSPELQAALAPPPQRSGPHRRHTTAVATVPMSGALAGRPTVLRPLAAASVSIVRDHLTLGCRRDSACSGLRAVFRFALSCTAGIVRRWWPGLSALVSRPPGPCWALVHPRSVRVCVYSGLGVGWSPALCCAPSQAGYPGYSFVVAPDYACFCRWRQASRHPDRVVCVPDEAQRLPAFAKSRVTL